MDHEAKRAPLDIAVRDDAGIPVVALSGELDVSNVSLFTEALVARLGQADPVTVVDFSGVRFVDSTGLNALVVLQRRYAAEGATLALVITDRRLLRLLEITGLDEVFRIGATAGEALQADDARSSSGNG